MVAGRVRHTVTFTLVHEEGSAEERDFFQAAENLANIPRVEAFELLAEVSREWLPVRNLDRVHRSGCLRSLQRAS